MMGMKEKAWGYFRVTRPPLTLGAFLGGLAFISIAGIFRFDWWLGILLGLAIYAGNLFWNTHNEYVDFMSGTDVIKYEKAGVWKPLPSGIVNPRGVRILLYIFAGLTSIFFFLLGYFYDPMYWLLGVAGCLLSYYYNCKSRTWFGTIFGMGGAYAIASIVAVYPPRFMWWYNYDVLMFIPSIMFLLPTLQGLPVHWEDRNEDLNVGIINISQQLGKMGTIAAILLVGCVEVVLGSFLYLSTGKLSLIIFIIAFIIVMSGAYGVWEDSREYIEKVVRFSGRLTMMIFFLLAIMGF